MKKSELRQIIKEELSKLNEKSSLQGRDIENESLNEGYEPKLRVTDETGYVEVEGPFSVVGDWMYDWFVDNDHIHGFTVEEID